KVERSGKRVDVKQTRYEAEYQTIKRLNKQGFKIKLLCKALSVSRAGYYKWLNRKPTKSEKRLNHLIDLIQHAYHEHKGIYGYRRHALEHVSENVLDREFDVEYKLMEFLLNDINEFKYGSHSKAYLSAIIDYGANEIVAFKLSDCNNNALVNHTIPQIEDLVI